MVNCYCLWSVAMDQLDLRLNKISEDEQKQLKILSYIPWRIICR